jgi:hypothetical protein
MTIFNTFKHIIAELFSLIKKEDDSLKTQASVFGHNKDTTMKIIPQLNITRRSAARPRNEPSSSTRQQ